MAFNQYDPYASQSPSIGSLTKDMAMSVIDPRFYLGSYLWNPTAYSTTKGLWTPFTGKGFKEGWSTMTNGARTKSMGQIFSGIKKMAFSPGRIGGGVINDSRIIKTQTDVLADVFREKIGNINMRHAKGHSLGAIKHTNHLSRISNETAQSHVEYINANPGSATAEGAEAFIKENVFRRNKMFGTLKMNTEEIKRIKSATGKLQTIGAGKVGQIGAKQVIGTSVKWAMRGGKILSGVGLAMILGEVALAIGTPIGKAAMAGIDSTLTNFTNRFNYNMGGKLALSYLGRGAATERQRALEAMQMSQITGRSAFGQEARYL